MKPRPAAGTNYLLAAGVVPIPWFFLWMTVAGLSAPGYRAAAQQASELSLLHGTPAALFSIAEWGVGIALIVFAAGLWRRSRRGVAWGAVCWIVFGWSMIANGIWPMGDVRHGFYSVGLANLIAPALSLAEDQTFANDQTMYRLTVIASGAGLLYLWLNLMGDIPAGITGLLQRAFFCLNALWPLVVALRVAFARSTS